MMDAKKIAEHIRNGKAHHLLLTLLFRHRKLTVGEAAHYYAYVVDGQYDVSNIANAIGVSQKDLQELAVLLTQTEPGLVNDVTSIARSNPQTVLFDLLSNYNSSEWSHPTGSATPTVSESVSHVDMEPHKPVEEYDEILEDLNVDAEVGIEGTHNRLDELSRRSGSKLEEIANRYRK